jgi:DNA-binding LacI/PurR family transcriptional regulator
MPLPKPVTMNEIARLAGVSRPAVSAALSGKQSTISLSETTRQRIKKIAEELGYRRNIVAQSFIKQKSFLIAFLGRQEHFVYALENTKGIEEALENTDYSLLYYYNGNSAAEQARYLRKSLERRVDGIIVAPAPERRGDTTTQQLRELYNSGFPVVQMYRKLVPEIPVVMVSDHAIGKMQTEYLLKQGHRRIAHYTYDDYIDRLFPPTSQDAWHRYQGYEQAMLEASLDPLVVTYPTTTYAGPGYSPGARQFADRVAHHSAKFTAVTTFCDHVAIGLLKGLRECGVSVPDAMSVIGCDNVDAACVTEPPLTTLRNPAAQMGREAVRMILEMMDGRQVSDAILAPEIVERASTAPPPIGV